jgi:hypothetical protein
MEIQQDLKALQLHDSFGRFIQMIHQLREETIQELHEADSEQIQQTAGRIISYDQILQIADWPMLQARFRDSL